MIARRWFSPVDLALLIFGGREASGDSIDKQAL
jgi:hypothetical protein